MGDSEPMAVLKQGDWVLWQDEGCSGVARVCAIAEGKHVFLVSPEVYGNPIAYPKYPMNLPIECCTKIDPAIAKVYGHNNV